MLNPNFIVQASSLSWSGCRDICMNYVRGQSAVYHTVLRLQQNFPLSLIVIAAPEFDRGGGLNDCLNDLILKSSNKIKLHFSHNESPLLRMQDAIDKHMQDAEAVIRINGLNMFFQPLHLRELWNLGRSENLACVTFPDDYPTQFTADYYDVNALNQISRTLPTEDPLHVHPKYAIKRDANFLTAKYTPSEILEDSLLIAAREDAKNIYDIPRDIIGGQQIPQGDTLSFHYTLALKHIEAHHLVLDIACGGAVGPMMLASKAAHVTGADLDADLIAHNVADIGFNSRLRFVCEDVTSTSFVDASFDLITSFETIEHVDADAYLCELHRLLKPDGLLFLSTPQNSLGHIPINPHHLKEYSLQEIQSKVMQLFDIEQIIGIKQGCIFFENDPVGTNTYMRLKRKNL
jgi:2-polyprenyl-3-methyl-5-hydroxy-6-metoxy-1,4-benzoquinol methylase